MSNVSSQPGSSNRPDKRATRSAGANPENIKISHAALTATAIPHPVREQREQLIKEAAYHHAESRGFEQGRELEDWLAAEAEVDARLSGEGRAY